MLATQKRVRNFVKLKLSSNSTPYSAKNLFKVNYRNARAICKICSRLAIKTPERSSVSIVTFEQISRIFLVFLLLTLNEKMPAKVYNQRCL